MSKYLRLALAILFVGVVTFAGWQRTAFGASSKHQAAATTPRVALLLAEEITPRWLKDSAYFQQKMAALYPTAKVDVLNANLDQTTQLNQANTELSRGAKVLVVVPQDQTGAAPIIAKAHQAGAKVIAYDRIIQSAQLDAYVSFDGVAVGQAQGRWLANHTRRGGTIVVINGATTDDNAHLFHTGYFNDVLGPMFKNHRFKLGGEYWTTGWTPANAGREFDSALAKNGNKVDGVLSANDGMAGAIIASLARVHLAGKVPVTGQDAQTDALQRLLLGTQGMTVYKPLALEANGAAEAANAFLRGQPLPPMYNRMAKTTSGMVHAALFKPVVVTKNNIPQTVIKDKFVTRFALCSGLPKRIKCP